MTSTTRKNNTYNTLDMYIKSRTSAQQAKQVQNLQQVHNKYIQDRECNAYAARKQQVYNHCKR